MNIQTQMSNKWEWEDIADNGSCTAGIDLCESSDDVTTKSNRPKRPGFVRYCEKRDCGVPTTEVCCGRAIVDRRAGE